MKSQNLAGLGFALAGFALLALGDAIVKTINGVWPGTAVAALRFSFGAAALFPLVLMREGRGAIARVDWRIQCGRAFALSLSSVCFFASVFLMPLADATAISFLSPMTTAFFSAWLLSERVPRMVWLSTLVAFLGVLIVLRPNVLAVGPAALLPVGSAFGMGAMITLNRMAAGTASTLAMQMLIATLATPMLCLAALAGHLTGWLPVPWPNTEIILKCAAVACTATLAHTCLFMATLRAPAAVIAPMTYVQLLVALILGFILFDDRPDGPALLGASLIIGSGLFIWRSQRNGPPK